MSHKVTRTSARRRDRARPHSLAVIGIAIAVAYLAWRTTTLGSGTTLLLSVPLFLAELGGLVQLSLFAFQAWSVPPLPAERAERTSEFGKPIALVVTAHNSTVRSLEQSLVGCQTLRGRTQIWVVEDEHREEVARLTASFNATYVTGIETSAHAIDSMASSGRFKFLIWLDAGQIPMPDLIDATLPKFLNHDLAVVQVGVELLNSDSLHHMRSGSNTDALLRDVIGPATSQRGAAPWFGPGSVIRCSALLSIGGLKVHGPAPVQQALALLHRASWETSFDARSLIRRNAPDSLSSYLDERLQRTFSILGILRTPQSPLRLKRLRLHTRLLHIAQLSEFGTGLRYLVFVAIMSLTLLTGRLPFSPSLAQMLSAWTVATVAQWLAFRALTRGTLGFGDRVREAWRTMGVEASALRGLPVSSAGNFPNSTTDQGIRALGQLRLLTVATVSFELAILLRAATLIDSDFLPSFSRNERVAALTLSLLMLAPMVDVLQVVVRRIQRRSEHRTKTNLDITVGDQMAETIDLTPEGVGVSLEHAPPIGETISFTLRLPKPDGSLSNISGEMTCRAASRLDSGVVRAGFEFIGLPSSARRAIIGYCTIHHDQPQDRRATARLSTDLAIAVSGVASRTIDLTPAGVGVVMKQAPKVGEQVRFEIDLPRTDGTITKVRGNAFTRAATPTADGRVRVGLEFDRPDAPARAALIRYCAIDHALVVEETSEAVAAPADLVVARKSPTTQSFRALTGVATVAAVATIFFGPAAGTAEATASPDVTTCLLDSNGAAIAGAQVRIRSNGSSWIPVGTTAADGCVTARAPGDTVEVEIRHAAVTSITTHDLRSSDSVTISTDPRVVRFLDPDGQPVSGAEIRYFVDEWQLAGVTDSAGEVILELLPTDATYEVLWKGQRVSEFRPEPDLTQVVIIMARLRADAGAMVTEVDLGVGWEPFNDGMNVLSGRLAVRLPNGSVTKLVVPPGHEISVPSGDLVELTIVTATTTSVETLPSTSLAVNPTTASPPTSVLVPTTTVAPPISAPQAPPTSSVSTTDPPAAAPSSAPPTTIGSAATTTVRESP